MRSAAFFLLTLLCLTAGLASQAQSSSQKGPTAEAQIRTAIRTFYTWYQSHEGQVSAFPIINVRQEVKAAPSVNWTAVKALHAYLRANAPQLGSTYYTTDFELLKEQDSLYKANPDEDMGFDYDRFTKRQEDPNFLTGQLASKNRWDITINGTTAYVTAYGLAGGPIDDFAFSWEMMKERGVWKIARICGDVECRG